MLDIGFWEIALIAMLALVVLGPKRLPEAARAAGYWVGRARQFVANAKSDLDQQIQSGGMEEIRRLKEELDETRRYIQQVAGKTESDISNAIDEIESDAENNIGGNANTKPVALTRRKKKSSRKKVSGKKTAKKASRKKSASKKKAAKKSAKKKNKKTASKKTASKKTAGKKSK